MKYQSLDKILAIGGKTNSLGKVKDVIDKVLYNKILLEELYTCMFNEDPWIRMRAADAFEKICRVHPEWIEPYIQKLLDDLSNSTQPSIQWHLAQIYQEVSLPTDQKKRIIKWLENLLSSQETDWIVSANSMKVLAYFVNNGDFPRDKFLHLLKIQLHHKSKTVVKKAHIFISNFS